MYNQRVNSIICIKDQKVHGSNLYPNLHPWLQSRLKKPPLRYGNINIYTYIYTNRYVCVRGQWNYGDVCVVLDFLFVKGWKVKMWNLGLLVKERANLSCLLSSLTEFSKQRKRSLKSWDLKFFVSLGIEVLYIFICIKEIRLISLFLFIVWLNLECETQPHNLE